MVVPNAVIDLSLVKAVSDAAPNVGDTVTFTISVSNAGPSDATGVAVQDIVPAGYSNIANISNGGTEAGGIIDWTGLSIANGASVDLTFEADVEATGPYVNVAAVEAADQDDVDSTPGNPADSTPGGGIGSEDPDGTQDANDEDDGDDAEVTPNLLVSLGSTVFNDANNNAIQDATESGIEGVVVQLFDSNGVEVPVGPDGILGTADDALGGVETDADGNYFFQDLVAGDYQVAIPASNFVGAGALTSIGTSSTDIATTPNTDATGVDEDDNGLQAGGSGTAVVSPTINLTPGAETAPETDVGGSGGNAQDDANEDSGDMRLDFGFFSPVSIGSVVWEDTNSDGTQDAGEPLIDEGTVTLLDGTGTPVTTDIDGNPIVPIDLASTGGTYLFDNLAPGDYQIQVSDLPAGFAPSLNQNAADDDDTATDSNIAVADAAAGTFTSGTFILESGGEPVGADEVSDIAGAGDDADDANDASGNMTVDFGFVQSLSVGSLVFEDLNGDGQQDANEPPIAGAVVALLVDDGGSFVPATDVAGAPVVSVTTGPDGLYLFNGLPTGDYQILVTPPSNFTASPVQSILDDDLEGDSNIAAETSTPGTFESPVFALSAGDEPIESGADRGDDQDDGVDSNGNMTLDFGFVTGASIGNFVWLDLDMDGIQDANEDGIPGVEVILAPPAGIDVGAGPGAPITTITGANGEYLFPDLPPFTSADPTLGYVVTVNPATLPNGLVQTFDEGVVPGSLGTLDNSSEPIQLSPEEEHLTADFGYAPPLGSIGDRVFIDADDDGVQDPGEPGIENVTVILTLPDGTTQTQVTDANGNYLFTNLPLDEAYLVEVDITTLPAGVFSSPSGLGDPDVRDGFSSVADNQTTVVLTVDDPVNLDADFGYLPASDQNNSVGDTIFLDSNEDGIFDANETPLAGVTVTLIDTSDGSIVSSDITNADGEYLFTGIPDGTFEVLITDQNNVLGGLTQTFDEDDGVTPTPVTPGSSIVELDPLSESTGSVNDSDQDFGFVDPTGSTGDGIIGDTVFFDFDGSGLPEPGEGIEGVVVSLFNSGPDGIIGTADDVLIASEATDENGNYLFTGLATVDSNVPGATDASYFVEIDESTLPNGGSGFINSVDPDTAGTGDSQSVVVISPAAPTDLDQDFGYIGGLNVISGTVFSDDNGNGLQEETGIFAGVTIELRDQNGNIVGTTVSDADGNYEFPNLPDGIYTVVVTDNDNILNASEHTDSPFGLTDTSDETSKDDTGYIVDLDSAGVNSDPVIDMTGDFGYEPEITTPISLGTFLASSGESNNVVFTWATQAEVANLGFNLYARIDGAWELLNDELIAGQGDSVSVQDYNFVSATSATVFAISDVDFNGQETLHGPFILGEQHGVIGERNSIDWSSERSEREAKAAERERVRQAEQKARTERKMQELRESQPESADEPSEDEETSMLETTMKSSIASSNESKESSYLNGFVAKMAAGLMAAIIPTAHAQEVIDWTNLANTEAGVHEITYAQLAEDGIDLEGLPVDQIGLVNQGAAVRVQVLTQDDSNTFGPGSVIRFVANSIDTLYTDKNIYTLRSGGVVLPIVQDNTPTPTTGRFATSYLASAKYSPQQNYSFSSPDESDPWYAMRILSLGSPVSESINLQLSNVAVGGNSGSTKANVKVSLWGATDLPGTNDHLVEIAFNGSVITEERFDGLQEKNVDIDLEQVLEGENQVKLTLPTQEGFDFDGVNVNEVEVNYPRQFIAQDDRLNFTSGFREFFIRGFQPNESGGIPDIVVLRERNGEIFEVTEKRVFCPQECLVIFGGTGQVENYYVTANVHTPEIQSMVAPSDITSGNARYVIISHPDFIGSAGDNLLEGYAQQLQSEIGNVDIVDVEQIYAQFGGHVFDPTAIKRYIQFANANRGTEYVLLVGGDVYDYRQFENEDATSFIPSLYAATGNNISFAPVDALYVDVDNDLVPDLPIGRLPVRTNQQLSNLLNKYRDFNNRSYRGTALVVADAFDEVQQYDFADDANEISESYLADYEVSQAYVDDLGSRNARGVITDEINQGVTITSFFGHSSTNQWSFNGLFTGNDAANLNNVGRPTVVMQWGCWNAYYVSPNEDSMGHRFMMEGEQGAVSVMGATTLTDANAERQLARLVFARLQQGERLGDAVTNAKQEYAQDFPDNLDVILGWTILGMPELLVD